MTDLSTIPAGPNTCERCGRYMKHSTNLNGKNVCPSCVYSHSLTLTYTELGGSGSAAISFEEWKTTKTNSIPAKLRLAADVAADVAVEVMGLQLVLHRDGWHYCWPNSQRRRIHWNWRPDLDAGDADEVVEKMVKEGWGFKLEHFNGGYPPMCVFFRDGERIDVNLIPATTRPLAICHAALAAVRTGPTE